MYIADYYTIYFSLACLYFVQQNMSWEIWDSNKEIYYDFVHALIALFYCYQDELKKKIIILVK